MEKENNINFSEEGTKNDIPQKSKKPNWFVCFFLVLADFYLSGFIGKNLVTGEKYPDRLVYFIISVFVIITKSLPIALFVSYFLIILPTWLFVLAIVRMAIDLLYLVFFTNAVQEHLTKPQKSTEPLEESKVLEEKANNHAKCYQYGADNTFYVYRWTTLIGDFFRYIVLIHFTGFVGKNVFTGKKLDSTNRLRSIFSNILSVIYTSAFWIPIISCFFITAPTWLFILAIMAAASELLSLFYHSYRMRQRTMKDIFFCKCQGENEWHASLKQVAEENRYDGIPECGPINEDDVKDCYDISSSSDD